MSRQAVPEPISPIQSDIDAGLKFYEQGLYSAAIRCYRLALRQDPESALGHYLLGLTLMACGDATRARDEWEAASRSEDDAPQTVWASSRARMLLDQVMDSS